MPLQYAQEQLRLWQDALAAASNGQSYSIGGRTLTRQDVGDIRAEIQRWNQTVLGIQASLKGNVRPLGATACFPAPGSGQTSGVIYPDELWRSGST